jgi:hypothetical protein
MPRSVWVFIPHWSLLKLPVFAARLYGSTRPWEKLSLLVLFGSFLLAGCQTEGISGNPIEELVAHPDTNGSRINSPPKGNCLSYATRLQDKLRTLYGIDSRLLLLELTDHYGTKQLVGHALLVYQYRGRTYLADNNHQYPVLARGATDEVWAKQMIPLFWDCNVISHNYRYRPENLAEWAPKVGRASEWSESSLGVGSPDTLSSRMNEIFRQAHGFDEM